MDQPDQEHLSRNLESLTDRELEIVELMQAGLSNKEIARQMSLAYETIKWYTKRIYSKLGIKNRHQLVPLLNTIPRPKNQKDKSAHLFSTPLTVFIGRTAEKEALLESIQSNRLVTILGPGGNGKTRLALEIGRLAPERLSKKPYFISAESFHTADELVFGLADLFNISLNHFDQPLNQISAGIPKKPSLLIIDNFETILDAASLLTNLLAPNPSLHILVTSRAVLNLTPEKVFNLEGLSQVQSASDQNEAVILFRARANLDESDSKSEIAKICELVDGSPLAIELAASWTRSLSCQQILHELKDGLSILTSSASDIKDRHRSIAAICEQSWLGLKPNERKAALKLGVFANNFTWEAAREIASISLQTITALLDQSIIRRVPGGRLSMHPVLRRFIQGQSKRLKFDPINVKQKYATYYMQLLLYWGQDIHSAKQIEALNAIEQELEHILQAWRWAIEVDEIGLLIETLQPLALYLEIRNHSKQGANLFAETLNHISGDNLLAAGLHIFKGWHEIWLGNTEEGASAVFLGMEILDAIGHSKKWPLPISNLSFNEHFPADIQQQLETRYVVAKKRYEKDQDLHGAAWMGYGLGNITRPSQRFKRSAAYFRESLALFESQQDYYGILFALDGLSTTLSRMGDLDGAWDAAMQLKATSLQLGDVQHLAVTAEMFGQICEKKGDFAQAYAEYLEGLGHAIVNTNGTTIVPHVFHLGRLIASHDLGPKDWGATLLTMVHSHPYSQAGWFAFRKSECETWLNTLKEKMDRDAFLLAIVKGKELDILEGAKQFMSANNKESQL